MENSTKERQIRRILKRLGYGLHKSRVKYPYYDNMGGYMVYDIYANFVVLGSRFEYDLDGIQSWLDS